MPKTEKAKKKSTSVKQEKKIHPNSRKAVQVAKTIHHSEKIQQRKEDLNSKQSILKEKILWFKDILEEDKDRYSLAEVSNIVAQYINRFDERLNEIDEQNELNKALGRHGRYHAAEEEAIKMVKTKERELFSAGRFEAPDLTNTANVTYLRKWDCQTKTLPNIKLKNIREIKESTESSKNVMEE